MIGFEVKTIDGSQSKLTVTPTRVSLKVSRKLPPDAVGKLRDVAEKLGEHVQPLIDRSLRGTFGHSAIVLRCKDKAYQTFKYVADGEITCNTEETK